MPKKHQPRDDRGRFDKNRNQEADKVAEWLRRENEKTQQGPNEWDSSESDSKGK